ncbi:MAG: transposase, partial [Acetobacteraceae bacterium]|nr:transposase [Acetobacteraceae bacterium]
MSHPAIPPILASLIARIAAAVPARARTTFLDLLLGAAATKGGHVTDAILAGGLSRGWRTYYWFLERGRWSWLRIWAALLDVLTMLFRPAVCYAVIDDSVVERVSTKAPGSLVHHNHTAKPNRPKFLRGQGWLCLAAVIERNAFAVGAVPLLLRLVRRGTNRGKLRSAGLLLRLLGQRLGHVRRLLDAWFMRAWLIQRALAAGHTVIGCVRRDLALFEVPKSPRKRKPGRPHKYGARLTPEWVAALPQHRSAEILYGKLEVVRYRTGLAAARFLRGRVVRAVWVELERPDRRDKPRVQRLLICTDPALSALVVINGYAKRWTVESLFRNLKHGFGL